MIGLLTGKVAYKSDPFVIIDVHGVGYKVAVSSTTLSDLNLKTGDVAVFTHTHVREDTLELYGFLDPADLRLFEYLIGVSGVGCKTALGIFSIGKREDILNAILRADADFFTAVPRLGKKNAQKIIIELKSKLGSTVDLDLSEGGSDNATVIEALRQFGYSGSEISSALKSLKDKDISENEKIRLALKYLGRT